MHDALRSQRVPCQRGVLVWRGTVKGSRRVDWLATRKHDPKRVRRIVLRAASAEPGSALQTVSGAFEDDFVAERSPVSRGSAQL